MKKRYIKWMGMVAVTLLLMACGTDTSDNGKKVVSTQAPLAETDSTEVVQMEESPEEVGVSSDREWDVDLTKLSSTMVYSEVYNMMSMPENYLGKKVKMQGVFLTSENKETGQMYFACIIRDATACCSQGIEFELEGEHKYPEDYPEPGTDITVSGIFETYEEDGRSYCRLQNAKLHA